MNECSLSVLCCAVLLPGLLLIALHLFTAAIACLWLGMLVPYRYGNAPAPIRAIGNSLGRAVSKSLPQPGSAGGSWP